MVYFNLYMTSKKFSEHLTQLDRYELQTQLPMNIDFIIQYQYKHYYLLSQAYIYILRVIIIKLSIICHLLEKYIELHISNILMINFIKYDNRPYSHKKFMKPFFQLLIIYKHIQDMIVHFLKLKHYQLMFIQHDLLLNYFH